MRPEIGVGQTSWGGGGRKQDEIAKEDGGRDQPTTSRRGRGGEAKSGRLEVCVQQRGRSAWGGASDLKPWILKSLWECMFKALWRGQCTLGPYSNG